MQKIYSQEKGYKQSLVKILKLGTYSTSRKTIFCAKEFVTKDISLRTALSQCLHHLQQLCHIGHFLSLWTLLQKIMFSTSVVLKILIFFQF